MNLERIAGLALALLVAGGGVFWLLAERDDVIELRLQEAIEGLRKEFQDDDRLIRDTFRAEDARLSDELKDLDRRVYADRDKIIKNEVRLDERDRLIERFIDREFGE